MGLALAACLLAGAAAAAAQPAAVKPTFNPRTGLFEAPFDELERAVARGDRAEIGRWAARIGPARLGDALRGSDAGRIGAALETVPLLPGHVRLIAATAPLVAADDPAVATRAARALGSMLDATEPRRFEEWDVPADLVASACAALAQAVARTGAALAVRLAAIDALAEAGGRCATAPLVPLVTDAAAEIRRAALLGLRTTDEIDVQALQDALADPDAQVTAAAAVVWCRRRAAGAVAAAETPEGPLRAIAAAKETPAEDAAELKACTGPRP